MAAGPVQLLQPHAPATMPNHSALGTPLSRASSHDLLGNAAPLAAEVLSPVEEPLGRPAAAAGAAADGVCSAVKAVVAGYDTSGENAAAEELAAADAGCSVELSVSGQQGLGGCTAEQIGCGAAPEASGVTVPVEDAEAAQEVPVKKRRKKMVQETIPVSLSPPGAFGRAVFGRKKRVRHFEHTETPMDRTSRVLGPSKVPCALLNACSSLFSYVCSGCWCVLSCLLSVGCRLRGTQSHK